MENLNTAIMFLATFGLAAIIAPPLIKYLKKLKFGQQILEIGPKWHMSKQGIPTMGGLIFIIPVTIGCLLFGLNFAKDGDISHLVLIGFSLLCGLVGFIDDYSKVVKKKNQGLKPLQKFMLQTIVAVALVGCLDYLNLISLQINVPFVHIMLHPPVYIFYLYATFVIVGVVNAVNITDGLDGLATVVTIPVMVFFALMATRIGMGGVELFCTLVIAALFGFLIFNFNPAKVFMGDTGSLFLGGAVAAAAFIMDSSLILVLVGLVYLIEVLSDIIQVTYFKATKGKRFFKMAPIHHHFEMCGLSEKQICFMFCIVTIVMCALAYYGIFGGLNFGV